MQHHNWMKQTFNLPEHFYTFFNCTQRLMLEVLTWGAGSRRELLAAGGEHSYKAHLHMYSLNNRIFFFLLLSLRLESISRGKQSPGAALCTSGERHTYTVGPVLTRVRSPFFGFHRGATLACDAIVRVHDFRSYDFKLTLLCHILLIRACYPK